MAYKRDYRSEYDLYQSSPKAKKERAARNKARADMKKKHGESAMKGKDVDHKKPLRSGGSKASSNTRLRSVSSNRSSNGHVSGEKQKRHK